VPGEDSTATGGGAVRPGTPGLPATCLYSHRIKGYSGTIGFPATCPNSHRIKGDIQGL